MKGFCAVLVACLALPSFGTLDYNAVRDFSMSSNPAGAWRYGFEATAGSAFNLLTYQSTRGWTDSASSTMIWYNDTGSDRYNIAAGQLALHPTQGGSLAVLRWTAPASGQYQVDVSFLAGHLGQTDYYVLKDSAVQLSQLFTNTAQSYSASLYFAAGSTLDVAVGPGNSNSTYSHTAVSAVITPTPEPVTMVLLGLGAVMIRRK
jgi:hypothetical protein